VHALRDLDLDLDLDLDVLLDPLNDLDSDGRRLKRCLLDKGFVGEATERLDIVRSVHEKVEVSIEREGRSAFRLS
jgi:hypothetical protein